MEEVVISGGKRTRTADILLAKQALYQLSYSPKSLELYARFHFIRTCQRTIVSFIKN